MSEHRYSVVIPCFNEESAIHATVQAVLGNADSRLLEIIVVDDGSVDGSAAELARIAGEYAAAVRVLTHPCNRGYGAALKSGIRHATGDLIVITDADGTYPNERIPGLVDRMDGNDMVVGARTDPGASIPLARRPAKWILGRLANTMSGRRIPDLNSGLRVMRRGLVERYLGLLPDGFSFTTTITLVMLSEAHRVEYVPVAYHRRTGTSKIRPVRDTLNFMQLICRAVLWFNPLRIFIPMSMLLVATGVAVLLSSMLLLGRAMDVAFAIFVMTGVLVLAVGMLADLIDKRLR